jgi:hypothetical protein
MKSSKEIDALKEKIEEAVENAKKKNEQERGSKTIMSGSKIREKTVTQLAAKCKTLEHPDMIMKSQHERFSTPKNCNNIEVRSRAFIVNSAVKEEQQFFDSRPADNMFLSRDKYRQGHCPFSEIPLGNLENVYICQMRIKHVQNRTKSSFGVTFHHHAGKEVEMIPGANTYADAPDADITDGSKRSNRPFHFIIPPGYMSVKEYTVHVNSYADNDYSELYPYMTASKKSIMGDASYQKTKKEYSLEKIHPIVYWVECNRLKYVGMNEPRFEDTYAFLPKKTVNTAVEELSALMRQVSIVDMRTLTAKVTKLWSEDSNISQVKENLYFEVEVVYLFREYSSSLGKVVQNEADAEEEVSGSEEEEDFPSGLDDDDDISD